MSATALKIPLLLLNAYCVHVAFTPPNPPPKQQEKVKYVANRAGDTIPMVELKGPEIQKAIVYITSGLEIYTILSTMSPSLPRSALLPYSADRVRITTEYLIMTALLATSAMIRLACYRELGRSFTYQLSVQKEHRLVTTGPYAIVRHPSYTALLMHFPLAMMAQLGRGSWWYESGLWGTLGGQLFVAAWGIFSVCFSIFFLQRATNEDKIMRKEFGGHWDQWARRTGYQFVPYLW